MFLLRSVTSQLWHVAGHCCWLCVSRQAVWLGGQLSVLSEGTEVMMLHPQQPEVIRLHAVLVLCTSKQWRPGRMLDLSASLLQRHIWVLLRVQQRLCGLGPRKDGMLRMGAGCLALVTAGCHNRGVLNGAGRGVSEVRALIAVGNALARRGHAGGAADPAAVLLRQVFALLQRQTGLILFKAKLYLTHPNIKHRHTRHTVLLWGLFLQRNKRSLSHLRPKEFHPNTKFQGFVRHIKYKYKSSLWI